MTARFDAQAQPIVHAPPPPAQHQQQLPPLPQPLQHQQQPRYRRPVPIEDNEDDQHHRVFLEDLRQRDQYDNCQRDQYDNRQRDQYDNHWERSFRVDIPEFQGGLRGDDLVDWLIAVEEILDFKQVPPPCHVSLVAMRFRGHAATWWKQLKTMCSRTGKAPIQS